MYKDVWSRFFDGDTAIIKVSPFEHNFTEEKCGSSQINEVIEHLQHTVTAVKNFYLNDFTGFSRN